MHACVLTEIYTNINCESIRVWFTEICKNDTSQRTVMVKQKYQSDCCLYSNIEV